MSVALPSLDKEYLSMGEVSRLTGLKAHTLRYWESSFKLLRPMRRASGHRKYTRRDVAAIQRLRELIYERKLTLAGARKVLREEAREGVPSGYSGEAAEMARVLREVKKELSALSVLLNDGDEPSVS